MTFRRLTEVEKAQLVRQGCRVDDWDALHVGENFIPDHIHNSWFSGENYIGRLDGTFLRNGDIIESTGIYSSRLHSCRIDDDVRIGNVGQLANMDVESGSIIENVNSLTVGGETTFGNGISVDVLNEAGGRSIRIFDRLSAQLAYIMIFYRHRPELIHRLEKLIDQYVQSKKSSRGVIGKNCRIRHSGVIYNVSVGPSAEISGALLLDNGAIISCPEAPVHIGAGVIAKRFIIQSGSSVKDGAQLNACFLGQSVQMGKQYSAENSLFFANSELFHGEGCSVFAGPYTVTHHKSTLLIAGYYSFYNAGSGSNQSNHMYKLGPVHQGILERGAKTGSSSYLLWPTRVGAFTNVIGKHYVNFDTTDLPFSFINEENGTGVIVPGMNLFTVGTKRDGFKWPTRDGRKDSVKLDLIHFPVLSPFTVGRMVRAAHKLRELAEQTPQKQESVSWNGLSVKRLMLRTSAKYYELAIQIFIGDIIVSFLEDLPNTVVWEDIVKDFDVSADILQENWIDAAGMLVSSSRMESFIQSIEGGEVNDLNEFERRLRGLYSAYDRDALHWALSLAAERRQLQPRELTREMLAELISEWKTSRLKLNNMILQDAGKEFSPSSMIGYGMDGSEAEKQADFIAVRGSFESNSFVKGLKEESEAVEKRATRLIERLMG